MDRRLTSQIGLARGNFGLPLAGQTKKNKVGVEKLAPNFIFISFYIYPRSWGFQPISFENSKSLKKNTIWTKFHPHLI